MTMSDCNLSTYKIQRCLNVQVRPGQNKYVKSTIFKVRIPDFYCPKDALPPNTGNMDFSGCFVPGKAYLQIKPKLWKL
jgi:hypothetical protein